MLDTAVPVASGVDDGALEGCIRASIRSAILCAGSRSWVIVQSAAYPWVASLGRAWLTSRLVSEGGSISSRSSTVIKELRRPWNQNLAPPALLMRA